MAGWEDVRGSTGAGAVASALNGVGLRNGRSEKPHNQAIVPMLTVDNKVSDVIVQSSQHYQQSGLVHSSRLACEPTVGKMNYKAVSLSLVP